MESETRELFTYILGFGTPSNQPFKPLPCSIPTVCVCVCVLEPTPSHSQMLCRSRILAATAEQRQYPVVSVPISLRSDPMNLNLFDSILSGAARSLDGVWILPNLRTNGRSCDGIVTVHPSMQEWRCHCFSSQASLASAITILQPQYSQSFPSLTRKITDGLKRLNPQKMAPFYTLLPLLKPSGGVWIPQPVTSCVTRPCERPPVDLLHVGSALPLPLDLPVQLLRTGTMPGRHNHPKWRQDPEIVQRLPQ